MLTIKSRIVATAISAFALLGACSIASAQPMHRHEIRKLEAKLQRLKTKENFEVHTGKSRAAARTQREIDRTRAELRSLRH